MSPFEEAKDEKEPCEKCGVVHEDIEEVAGQVKKMIDQIGPGPMFLKFLGAMAVSVITGGIVGLCWNYLAPVYFYTLPDQFHHVTWWNAIVFMFMVRAFLILVKL